MPFASSHDALWEELASARMSSTMIASLSSVRMVVSYEYEYGYSYEGVGKEGSDMLSLVALIEHGSSAHRLPQSSQSVPGSQAVYWAPMPPSSQSPSAANSHVPLQQCRLGDSDAPGEGAAAVLAFVELVTLLVPAVFEEEKHARSSEQRLPQSAQS